MGKHYFSTILGILLWSSSFIATKIAYGAFTPMTLCLARFVTAALLITLFRHFSGEEQRPARKDLRPIFLSSLLGIGIYYACENVGISLTSAGTASLIAGSYPAITVLVGALVYHIPAKPKQIAGILAAMFGIVLLSASPEEGMSSHLTGCLLLVFCGFLWAFYNFVTQSIPAHYSTMTVTFYQILFSTVLFIPLVVLEKQAMTVPSPKEILAVLYLGAGCSFLAYLFYNYGLRGISASAAASIMNLMPVFGLLFSFTLLHEPITLLQIAGGAAVILGVVISSRD